MLDGQEKALELQNEIKLRKYGHNGEREGTYAPAFRDPNDINNDNGFSNQDKYSKYMPDDEIENDNGY